MKAVKISFAVMGFLVSLVGGAGAEPRESKMTETGLTITCQLSYTAPSDAESEQRKMRLDLRDAEQPLRLGETIKFKDMAFSTRYARDYLAIDILNVKTNKAICRHVYNFGKHTKNQFEGDNGFTGLVYVFHPGSGAELQFYCKLER